jgi:hypothetical protein
VFDRHTYNGKLTAACTLDVQLGGAGFSPLLSLTIDGWGDSLTLNKTLTVAGDQNHTSGVFLIEDNSVIQMTDNGLLTLINVEQFCYWTDCSQHRECYFLDSQHLPANPGNPSRPGLQYGATAVLHPFVQASRPHSGNDGKLGPARSGTRY